MKILSQRSPGQSHEPTRVSSWRAFLIFISLVIALLCSFIWMEWASQSAQASSAEINLLPTGLVNGQTSFWESESPSDVSSIYLPAVYRNNKAFPTSPLGEVTLDQSSYLCDQATDQYCYGLTVTCGQLTEPVTVTLRVGEPSQTAPFTGTITFFSGFTGTYLWEGTASLKFFDGEPVQIEQDTLESGALSPDGTWYSPIIADLRANGFRTVQVDWGRSWLQAKSGMEEGIGNLSCRPASILKWVFDNLHASQVDKAFCADGHSNGASQLAYSLTRYGMGKYIDLAVFESGPNFTYLDQGCIQDDPAFSDVWYTSNSARNTIDTSYGYASNLGPCYKKLPKYRTTFQNDSLGLGNWQFNFPRTKLAFFFGDLDTNPPTTRNQGIRYYDLLVTNGSPLMSRTNLPNTGHNIGATVEGQQALIDTLRTQCVAR